MADIWFISDTHLAHTNILKFKRQDGSLLRDFHSTWEMEGIIFERWCEAVKPQDKIYHLGDVAFTQAAVHRMRALPGHKRLVRGNHDLFKTSTYLSVFEEIYGVRQIDRFWFTHIPMHKESVNRARLNVHGHLHANQLNDDKYLNVCVENLDYRPVNFDEIKAVAIKRGY